MQQVIVTGASGFIGSNLAKRLETQKDLVVQRFSREASDAVLAEALAKTDAIFHLAGVNRPQSPREFEAGNAGLTTRICNILQRIQHTPTIIFSSSIHATTDTPYGESKRKAEEILVDHATATASPVAIFRLPNVFGKWSRPFYNSVVATFCHQRARNLSIDISDPGRKLQLAYIDDVVDCFVAELHGASSGPRHCSVAPVYEVSLAELADRIESIRTSRTNLMLPNLKDPLTKKLYATYLSHLPENQFAYPLRQRCDERGSLAEFVKSDTAGQIFVSRTKPGKTRGNHYHHTKAEKFLVLEGEAKIRLRHIERSDVIEYSVRGEDYQVVDIPPGYTHSIENCGTSDMVVLFWASEMFCPDAPDTMYLDVAAEREKKIESSNDRRDAA